MCRSLAFVCLALALASFPARTALQGQTTRLYTVEDIGTLGVNNVSGLAINDNGDIAGCAQLPSGEQLAFRFTDARGIEDLGHSALGWLWTLRERSITGGKSLSKPAASRESEPSG